jgi:formate hydrogenlyase subunit 3/multisubunit Na+/H+ antiporter MnhD subunit
LELSNLNVIFQYSGIEAILIGGALCSLERRAGRLMSFAALFALGFVFLDLARGTLEGMSNAVLESFARALGLALMAASITIARSVENRWLNYTAIVVFVVGILTLAGIAPGISLATRWNLLLELEATDARLFYLAMLATIGVLVGMTRFVMLWLEQLEPQSWTDVDDAPPAYAPDIPAPFLARVRNAARSKVTQFGQNLINGLPQPIQRSVSRIANDWRIVTGILLLTMLALFVLYYNVSPNFWFQRVLETTQQLTFLR